VETYADPRDPPPQPVRCANCRITLRGERVIVGGRDYCCEGCAAGGPCAC
jgi:hypothetical protein